jgi:serine protease Do
MRHAAVLLFVVLLAGAASAAETETSATDLAAIARTVAPGLVKVEYTLQFDKGEGPSSHGRGPEMMMGGRFESWETSGPEEVIQEERPWELGGFLVAPTTVVAPDPVIHPRFVKSIAVRFGNETVQAEVSGYAIDQNAVFLTLAAPLKSAKPLTFDAAVKGPYFTAAYRRVEGAWTTVVAPMPTAVAVTEAGRQFGAGGHAGLAVDRIGRPVALLMRDELPLDDSWKGAPETWATLTAAGLRALLADLEARAAKGLPRVKLNFRSPKKTEGSRMYGPSRYSDRESATEMNVVGVLLRPTQVLVLANLQANSTARLEQIRVYAGPQPVTAKFAATLSNYGAFLVNLDQPLEGVLTASQVPVLDLRTTLLPAVEIRVQGEKLQSYFQHRRVQTVSLGWKQHLYPMGGGYGEECFLFDRTGALLAVPLAQRRKVAVTDRYGYRGDMTRLTALADLNEVFADLAKNTDVNNVPLTEEEENRIAWMGVELQGLNPELARINKVSDLTNDGSTGALVAYVYPNSPADKSGIKIGDILLRLHAEDQPKPIEVRAEDSMYGGRAFPWEQLDRVPEEYFDQIPQPWPSAESQLNRSLTDLGFGKKFVAEFFCQGTTKNLDFVVVQSPAHYDSGPRFKSAALGLTVRDLTYEVRRYFQKTDAEPGVIVSKIEPGSKASVAGVKPYEIITHVNDQPVMNVKDFERLAVGTGELRLSVKRMTLGRIVKVSMAGAATQPRTAPRPVPMPQDE